MGKCGCFFSTRQRSRFSRKLTQFRRSWSSGKIFNPKVSCSNRCVCAIFFTSILKQKGPPFHFFGTTRLSPFSASRLFRKFFMVPKGSPFNLQQCMVKNPKGPNSDFSALFSFFEKSLQIPFNFLIFCNRMDGKKSQWVPLSQFSAL